MTLDEEVQALMDVSLDGLDLLGSAIEGEHRSVLCAEGLRVAPAKERLDNATKLAVALVSMAHAPLGVPVLHTVWFLIRMTLGGRMEFDARV